MNAGSSRPILESPIGTGVNEKAFTIIARAYGGEGASKDTANAKSAYSLLYGRQDTSCMQAYIQTRVANLASVDPNAGLLIKAYPATTGKGAGGSS